MNESDLSAVLQKVASRLDPAVVSQLCLVGTAAALAQGVSLPASDIDFLAKDRAAVDAFADSLNGYPILSTPSLLEGGVQYFAALEIDGIRVEVSTVEVPSDSSLKEVTGQGPWIHQTVVAFGDASLPVVALELRLATELMRDRKDRYLPLIRHFKTCGETQLLLDVLVSEGLEAKYRDACAQL